MKNSCLFIVTCIFFFSSCNKENKKGCWRGYDALLVETGVVCNKTKEEAKNMPYTAFVCPADEKKYCWKLSDNSHLSCFPQSIMEEFFNPRGITFTQENCTGVCRYKRSGNNGGNIAMQYSGKSTFSKLDFVRLPLVSFYIKTNLF